jgi:signal transduction histidine kinase
MHLFQLSAVLLLLIAGSTRAQHHHPLGLEPPAGQDGLPVHPTFTLVQDSLVQGSPRLAWPGATGYSLHHPGTPRTTSIWFTGPITLAHDQNTLAFQFGAPTYAAPQAGRLRYRLDGYDADWRSAGPEKMTTYTGLPPGDYVFRVQATGGDGSWEEPGATIPVAIHPPWWQTTWAFLTYGLLLLTGVLAGERVQRRRREGRARARAREQDQEAAREIEQAHEQLRATQQQLLYAEKMASLGALTAGIAHEIKNPLTFVNNFAELNAELTDELFEELDADPDLRAADLRGVLADMRTNALKIREQGRRADALVRAMVQHASGGTGEREALQVNTMVEEYVNLAYHGMRAQAPGFNVAIVRDYDEAAGSAAWVSQEIGRVLINLLNNAFYAVHERAKHANGTYEPTVTISTRRAEGGVEIRVADNGPGIPAAVRERIFEPFYTTKPTGSGTGLGLSLSYEIVVQDHGGTMTLETESARGATFIVTLPR